VAAVAAELASRGPAGISAGPRAWLWGSVAITVGAAAAAVALAPPGRAPAPAALAFLLFAGSSAHVASTGWFYTVPAVRAHMRQHRARYLWCPLALIAGAGAIVPLVPVTAVYWLLLPYFGWQFFHFQKQNLGIAALAAAAGRLAPLRRAERGALVAAGAAAIAGLLARPGLLQLPIRAACPALRVAATVTFGCCVAAGLRCLASRRPGDRPAGFCGIYLCSLLFGLPVFLFSSPYAAVAGLTVAHGLQYLVLMTLLAAGGETGARRIASLAALGNIALLGGALLSTASDQLHGQAALRVLYGLFVGAVMAHFVIDAGLWRLRDAFPRAFLRSRLPYLLPAPGPVAGGES
jgi:hypothetical protein